MPSGGRLYIYTVIRFRPECLTRSGRLSTGPNRYRVKQFCVGFTHFCADLIKYLILRVYCICILYTVYYTVIPKRPRPIRQRNRALFNPRTVRLHYDVIYYVIDFVQSHCSFYFVSKNRHFFKVLPFSFIPLSISLITAGHQSHPQFFRCKILSRSRFRETFLFAKDIKCYQMTYDFLCIILKI